MAEARMDENWKHTASMMAMLMNANRWKSSDKVWMPADFPRHREADKPAPKAPITMLKVMCNRSK